MCRIRKSNRSQKMNTEADTNQVPPGQPIHLPVNHQMDCSGLRHLAGTLLRRGGMRSPECRLCTLGQLCLQRNPEFLH